ncbi:LysM peptidoglycan-binding domain-containing protein [Heyndrickxia acidicola]|uniref:LysM peptidoglycan-binding domain-containing protein n=1 Tax=Heyndrickxia acidicola TaxID=209389 RepID=A0ABU6MHL8_9BACI|nr:LysM peptidoglycan-binding domain-containing protein [Heyndrickxia acidicola]MED1204005.1 LysM peptidoglycan-binding domain-containing protein [Heyndrickxia acidicola]
MIIHVVKKGETLIAIAQQYSISTGSLVRANGLENPNRLVIGQALIIPYPFIRYTVRPGDTIANIISMFGVRLDETLQLNHLTDPSSIYPGQRIMIPIITHTVKPGDTLALIAQKYGVSVQEIMQENSIANAGNIRVGQSLRIPAPFKKTIEVNAFTTVFGQAGAREVKDVAHDLTYVAPFGYRIRKNGSLDPLDDVPTIRAAMNGRVLPIMAITNFSATETGTSLAHTILSNDGLVDQLLTNILLTMKNKGYKGLNIDFENVSPADRENYNRFLEKAVTRLHPEGYNVSSSLAPKTSSEQKGLLYEAHDYQAHGRILDFVIPMTYEWGYRLGPPQAISPLNLMKQVIEYAVTVVPSNKILLGFQVYARDWLLPHKEGQEAETFDMQEALRRAIRYNATIQYNQTSQSPFFRYTDNQGRQHEVWFEDARSAQAKLNLVKEFNLKGVSYWVLGYPFPQNWTLLENNFVIKKF